MLQKSGTEIISNNLTECFLLLYKVKVKKQHPYLIRKESLFQIDTTDFKIPEI